MCRTLFFQTLFPPFGDSERIDEYIDTNTGHFFAGKLSSAVMTSSDEIDYLDESLLKTGILGDVFIETREFDDGHLLSYEAILPKDDFRSIYISSIEDLIQDVQALAAYAAIAYDTISNDYFKRVIPDDDFDLCLIKSELIAHSDFNSTQKDHSYIHSVFSNDEIEMANQILTTCGYGDIYDIRPENGRKVFVTKSTMTDAKVAALVFTWFMNSLFEGSAETYYSGNTFKVDYSNGKFTVLEHSSPFQDLYLTLSKYAEKGYIKLCKTCNHAFIDKKSRGNPAKYCSRSCNTKASNKRKEKAQACKAADIPIEEAIDAIGREYEGSIRRWYQL